MADTFSPLLRIRNQATGGNRNTWGGLLNTDSLNLLEKAIAGVTDVTVAGADVTLTTNNGATDQSRSAILNLVGSPGAARNIIIPQVSKHYVVRNDTGSDMTITTDTSSEEVTVADGVTTFVMCNGTDVIEVKSAQEAQAADAAKLGGIPAAQWARLDASQDFIGGQGMVPDAMSMSASVTPDLDLANVFTGTLTANTTIQTPTDLPATGAQLFFLHLQQAGSGGPWTVAFSAFYDFLGFTPTMPQDASASMLVQCLYLPAYGKAICFSVEQVATGTLSYTFAANEDNVDVYRRLGSPSGVVVVNLSLADGVVIGSKTTALPALDFSGGFAAGSVINFNTGKGYVIGKGGRGGHASLATDIGSANPWGFSQRRRGGAGGTAIKGPAAGVTLNIVNANGFIWGGGGGGGCGGSSVDGDGQTPSGGAGGGGAGLGEGGDGIYALESGSSATESLSGTDGARNLDGTSSSGAGATGATTGGGYAGNGGAGGDFGAAGTAGTGAAAHDVNIPGGAAGAAGKAIDVNGATLSLVSGASSPHVKGAVS